MPISFSMSINLAFADFFSPLLGFSLPINEGAIISATLSLNVATPLSIAFASSASFLAFFASLLSSLLSRCFSSSTLRSVSATPAPPLSARIIRSAAASPILPLPADNIFLRRTPGLVGPNRASLSDILLASLEVM